MLLMTGPVPAYSCFRRFHKNIMYHSRSNEVALNMATRTSFSYLLARILTICASSRRNTHKQNFADCMGSLPLHESREISSNSCKLIPFSLSLKKKKNAISMDTSWLRRFLKLNKDHFFDGRIGFTYKATI